VSLPTQRRLQHEKEYQKEYEKRLPEINMQYQLVMNITKSTICVRNSNSGPPQIWPHLAALLVHSSQRSAAAWSAPVTPCAIRVGILFVRMKEHDA
jgi:hypothetical protein